MRPGVELGFVMFWLFGSVYMSPLFFLRLLFLDGFVSRLMRAVFSQFEEKRQIEAASGTASPESRRY